MGKRSRRVPSGASFRKHDFLLEGLKRSQSQPLLGNQVQVPVLKESARSRLFISEVLTKKFSFRYDFPRRQLDPKKYPGCEDLCLALRITWSKLKIAYEMLHELEGYLRLLWNNCLTLNGQKIYAAAMEQVADRNKVPRLVTDEDMSLLEKFIEILTVVDTQDTSSSLPGAWRPELWIPVTAFPLWEERADKFKYGLEDAPNDAAFEYFKTRFDTFFDKIAPKELNVIPGGICASYSQRRYNDAGVSRRDCEKPQTDFNSSFLLKEVMTKNLSPREIYLPGWSLKVVNNWWMRTVKLLTRNIPWWVMDLQGFEVVEKRARHNMKLSDILYYFDLPGFGLQYPRGHLKYMAKAIAKKYRHPVIDEMTDLLCTHLDRYEVQISDGTFIKPPRGIGLGYFENLKALGVAAVLDELGLESFFGDQGLIQRHPMRNLNFAGFLTKPRRGGKADEMISPPLLWSGVTLEDPRGVREPRCVWTSLFGALNGEFHWERKQALAAIGLHPLLESQWKIISYTYERLFGYEFYAGDSMAHPSNLGVNQSAQPRVGILRDYRVRDLRDPGRKIVDTYVHDARWQKPYSRSDAKRFSIRRKKVYKHCKPMDTTVYNYAFPLYKEHKSKKPEMDFLAKVTPSWMEERMIIHDRRFTGKIVSGLNYDEQIDAILRFRYSRDPFFTRATGGYEILTQYRGSRAISDEVVQLTELLKECSENEHITVIRQDLLRSAGLSRWDVEGDQSEPEEVVANAAAPSRARRVPRAFLEEEEILFAPPKPWLIRDKFPRSEITLPYSMLMEELDGTLGLEFNPEERLNVDNYEEMTADAILAEAEEAVALACESDEDEDWEQNLDDPDLHVVHGGSDNDDDFY